MSLRTRVVALGKIGLPLAVQFASKGHEVVGADVSERVVDLANDGVEPFPGEHGLAAPRPPAWHDRHHIVLGG